MRAIVSVWKQAGHSVAVVPTMGALHDGHLALVDEARRRAARVVATIFVNPKQFNNPADLARYPRTEERDAAMLAGAGADLLYAPGIAEMYPDGFATTVTVKGIADTLEGAFRPGHFEGVATVVAKLLLQTQADVAIFGEKDYQQLQVVRRMARDLNIPIEIVGLATVRDPDGLAQSSRNTRLTKEQRAIAPGLNRAMNDAAREIVSGTDVNTALAAARAAILNSGFASVDYVELRAADDLTQLARLDRPARLLAAAFLGEVRLIDNIAVG
jgi:pantoate--beta-alanine ligase